MLALFGGVAEHLLDLGGLTKGLTDSVGLLVPGSRCSASAAVARARSAWPAAATPSAPVTNRRSILTAYDQAIHASNIAAEALDDLAIAVNAPTILLAAEPRRSLATGHSPARRTSTPWRPSSLPLHLSVS